jgi:hypothetical protein
VQYVQRMDVMRKTKFQPNNLKRRNNLQGVGTDKVTLLKMHHKSIECKDTKGTGSSSGL